MKYRKAKDVLTRLPILTQLPLLLCTPLSSERLSPILHAVHPLTDFKMEEYQNYLPEATRAPEDIRGRMKLNYILNSGPVADSEYRASEPHTRLTRYMPFLGLATAHYPPPHRLQETESIAYPGHPAFSHGSMGMNLLTSGFGSLPVANTGVDKIQNWFGDEGYNTCSSSASDEEAWEVSAHGSVASRSSPFVKEEFVREELTPCLSPGYTPTSASSELSSVPDYGSGSSPVVKRVLITEKATSPWQPDIAPSSASSELSSLPDYESEVNPTLQPTAILKKIPISLSCPARGLGFPLPRDLAGSPPLPIFSPVSANPVLPQVWARRQAAWPGFEEDLFSSAKKIPTRKCHTNRVTRYEDGEVLRYGAGESYRPFNRDRDRSPRRARSPIRDRDRERDRDHRARTPPVTSDSYVPNRSPRRRSRSPDRYRAPDRARDSGGESWRRRDSSRGRARSPVRRVSPRRSPRRSPNRYSPGPRRDDRFDRVRSPRRDFDNRDR